MSTGCPFLLWYCTPLLCSSCCYLVCRQSSHWIVAWMTYSIANCCRRPWDWCQCLLYALDSSRYKWERHSSRVLRRWRHHAWMYCTAFGWLCCRLVAWGSTRLRVPITTPRNPSPASSTEILSHYCFLRGVSSFSNEVVGNEKGCATTTAHDYETMRIMIKIKSYKKKKKGRGEENEILYYHHRSSRIISLRHFCPSDRLI
jgi:hypothetical protein